MTRAALKAGTVFFSVIVILLSVYLSIRNANPIARSWDEVDFALALYRFDLLAMQPHFPGYPYFILGATVIHRWIQDPVQALSVFNTLAAFSSAIPMALLAHRFTGGGGKSLLFAAFVLTSPYLWLMSARPMSECAGIAVLWWFLWSVRTAMGRPGSMLLHIVPLLLFGLLMGTRLSFFPFGIALLPLWAVQYKRKGKRGRRLWLSFAAALSAQLVWVVGLALSEGTLSGFWKLSVAFIEGHFSEWGGGVASSNMEFGRRLTQLMGHNLIGHALLGGSAIVGILLALLLAVTGMGLWQRRLWRHHLFSMNGVNRAAAQGSQPAPAKEQANRQFYIWLAVSSGVYVLWALFGQNIEKPRHIAPVVGPILFFIYCAAYVTASSLWAARLPERLIRSSAIPIAIHVLLFALVSAQITSGANLLQRQAAEVPAVYQLHRYASELKEPFLLYTWEETRVLQYLGADYEHRRIFTYKYFEATAAANPERRVLLTDHVLQGFEQQGGQVREQVKPVAVFKSDPLFDPVYADITLYEWIKK
ncbi:hypothetical protein [Paenibacillus harenae]|uniref:hypothetical protein n=1 Tax=Paenibacillus harenae TaxID=306543 RepID=UPI0004295854|nr:hypothetical protein [Paenibacillus harenae]